MVVVVTVDVVMGVVVVTVREELDVVVVALVVARLTATILA